MHDMNTMCANYAVTAAACADACRQSAADLRRRPATGWAEYDGAAEREARRHDAEAAKWDSRAEHARNGLILVHVGNTHHQYEHRDLIAQAASGVRVVSVES
jgi:hypothetical protein